MKPNLSIAGKEIIKNTLSKLNLKEKKYKFSINPNQLFGDYSTNVAFLYVAEFKKSPYTVAKVIASEIIKSAKFPLFFEKITVEQNGYINFFVSKKYLLEVLNHVNNTDKPYSGFLKDDNNTYVIEFSSPDMVKPFTIGYLRSTIIGDSISKVFSYSGKNVIRDNHLGDWGIQFGKIIYAVLHFTSINSLKHHKDPYLQLLNLYKLFLEREKFDNTLTKKANEYFLRIEAGDEYLTAIWREVRLILIKGLFDIYKMINISFDTISWESDVRNEVQTLIDALLEAKIAEVSNGAVIINLEKQNLSKLILRKQSGVALYGARELSTDKKRISRYGKNLIIINEVGDDQELYLKQIYFVEKNLGWFSDEQRHHLTHGMYRLDKTKMDSRTKFNLKDTLLKISRYIEAKHLIEKEESLSLAIGAIRLHDFRHPHTRNIDFDLNLLLKDDASSIFYIRKVMNSLSVLLSEKLPQKVNIHENDLEGVSLKICRKIQKFPEILEYSINKIQVTKLTQYTLDLMNLMKPMFKKKDLSNTEIYILLNTKKILNICFDLLGIKI